MDLHGQIMNLPATDNKHDLYANTAVAYMVGHRDARHAAAEVALGADAQLAEVTRALRELLEVLQALQRAGGIWPDLQGRVDAAVAKAVGAA